MTRPLSYDETCPTGLTHTVPSMITGRGKFNTIARCEDLKTGVQPLLREPRGLTKAGTGGRETVKAVVPTTDEMLSIWRGNRDRISRHIREVVRQIEPDKMKPVARWTLSLR